MDLSDLLKKPASTTFGIKSLYTIYDDDTVKLLTVNQLDGCLRNSDALKHIQHQCHKLQMSDLFISQDLRTFTGVFYKKDPEGVNLGDYDFYDDIGDPPYWCTRSCVGIFGAPEWINSLCDIAPEAYNTVLNVHCTGRRATLYDLIEKKLGAWLVPQIGSAITPSLADKSILVKLINLWSTNSLVASWEDDDNHLPTKLRG